MEDDANVLDCRDRRVARVLGYISRDLSKRVPLALAAKIAGLEARYFSKRFHRTIGLTFAEWNMRTRMDEAKRLLEIDDLSITAVAAAVGYDDLTTFERAFRRCEQLCPREYRRLLPSSPQQRQQTPNSRQQTPSSRQQTPRSRDGNPPTVQLGSS